VSGVAMLDLSSPVPLYFQLQEILRRKILDEYYKPGDLIPTEKELQELYNVSRITVRNAVNGLVFEDLLIKKQGLGTIVAYPRMQEEGNSKLQSFTEKMEQQGYKISTEVLDVSKIPAVERISEHLNIADDEEIIYSKRLRKVDGEPIALFENYISTSTGVSDEDDFSGSIFKLLEEKYSIKISGSEKEIEAGIARKEDAELLNITAGDPVLIIRYATLDNNNKCIEFAEGIYRADRYKYMLKLKR
jgi:GntR family transcriptional regulator, N-acetylglucosamine utilization regulator